MIHSFFVYSRKKMKYYSLIIFCLFLICCSKNNEKSVKNITTETVNDVVNSENIYYHPEEKKESNLGTWRVANVIENNVNVRKFPSLEAEILFKIKKEDTLKILGVSGEKVNIDNFNGNWLFIMLDNDSEKKGWVFSKYTDIGEIEYSPIKFVDYIPGNEKTIPLLKMSYNLRSKEIIAKVDYDFGTADYYIIVWDILQYDYHYTNRPGIYILNKKTNELRHITYLGTFEMSPHAETLFTDDFEYLIQDSGTSKGVRGIKAWRLKDLKEVYSGSYYRIKITHHTIEVVYPYGDWYIQRGYVDEEIKEYGKKYEEENKKPQDIVDKMEKHGFGAELLIRCSYNLDNGERKILGGEYIITQ